MRYGMFAFVASVLIGEVFFTPINAQAANACPLNGAVTINFDSIPSSPSCVDATNYLSSVGVTFTPITPGTTPIICAPPPGGSIPTSSPNWFNVAAASGQSLQPLSYSLQFCTEVSSITFSRVALPGSTLPKLDCKRIKRPRTGSIKHRRGATVLSFRKTVHA